MFGVSKGTIAMWEAGKRKPDFKTLCTLSELFDKNSYLIALQNIRKCQIRQLQEMKNNGRMVLMFGA